MGELNAKNSPHELNGVQLLLRERQKMLMAISVTALQERLMKIFLERTMF